MLQQKRQLVFQCPRLQRRCIKWRIRRTYNNPLVPWDRKQDAPIIGVWHHDRTVSGQKGAIEHNVDALAGLHHWDCSIVVHLPHGICKYTRRVDHNMG